MTKKHRVLIVSFATVLLAVALIVGATYALFSNTQTVTNHLQAGTLKVRLVRVSGSAMVLDNTGKLTEKSCGVKDFTDATTDNIFGLAANDLIVPGSTLEANLKIKNGGNVAFGYWIELVINGELTEDESAALAEQLRFTLVHEGETVVEAKKLKAKGLFVGSNTDLFGPILVQSEADLSVKVEFEDLKDTVNNTAQTGNFSFDLIVHAVQQTA